MSQASNPVYHNTLANYGPGAYGNISYSSGHGASVSLTDVKMALTPSSKMPMAYITLVNGDVEMLWVGFEDDGGALMALFVPEDDITTREYMLVNQCMLLIFASSSQGATAKGLNPIEYIRKNHLERHFVFTQPKQLSQP